MPIHVLKPRITRSRKVYVGRHRVHHGAFGVLLTLVGVLMAWHDRKDAPWPFIDRV